MFSTRQIFIRGICLFGGHRYKRCLFYYPFLGESWYTDRNGKRKTIRAQTEEALLDKLIPLYLDRENLEKKTSQELFEEWIAYKAQITTSPNTILRHRQHFKKYIASSKLYQIRILKITEILLETECNRIVKDFKLSNKEWVNLKKFWTACLSMLTAWSIYRKIWCRRFASAWNSDR